MKKIMIAALGFSLLSGTAALFAQNTTTSTDTATKKKSKKKKKSTSTSTDTMAPK